MFRVPRIKSKGLVAKLANWRWNVSDSGSPAVKEVDSCCCRVFDKTGRSGAAIKQSNRQIECRYIVIRSRNPTGVAW